MIKDSVEKTGEKGKNQKGRRRFLVSVLFMIMAPHVIIKAGAKAFIHLNLGLPISDMIILHWCIDILSSSERTSWYWLQVEFYLRLILIRTSCTATPSLPETQRCRWASGKYTSHRIRIECVSAPTIFRERKKDIQRNSILWFLLNSLPISHRATEKKKTIIFYISTKSFFDS